MLQQINAAVESSREAPEPGEAASGEALSELLTRREYQVCKLIIAGNTNRSIADELGISVSTVEFHRANLMDKLQVNSLAELIKLALKLDS